MRSKARLTITLDWSLLRQIDQMVDHMTIRNRSHAIETLLRQSLVVQLDTAVLLAGGKEKSPLPPLQSIGGKPLAVQMVEHLVTFGFDRIFVLAGKNQASFKEILQNGDTLDAEIHYVPEPTPMGTAGAVKLIESELSKAPFLVMNADVLTNINLADFISFHQEEESLVTVAVKPRDAEHRYGKVLLKGNKVTTFNQPEESEGISIVNTGVYLLQPEVLGLIEEGQVANFETDLFPKLANMGELSAYFFQGVWFDISTPETYHQAEKRWWSKER
jgi:mannose-1-phosphate guanylyltransferase/phosphomannomutase